LNGGSNASFLKSQVLLVSGKSYDIRSIDASE
jgi:hypothetical protein